MMLSRPNCFRPNEAKLTATAAHWTSFSLEVEDVELFTQSRRHVENRPTGVAAERNVRLIHLTIAKVTVRVVSRTRRLVLRSTL